MFSLENRMGDPIYGVQDLGERFIWGGGLAFPILLVTLIWKQPSPISKP